MKNIFITISLFFLSFYLVHAQKETKHWFFGEFAGLKFNQDSSVFQQGTIGTSMGCASISDSYGNLLFYATSGDQEIFSKLRRGKVVNRNHKTMPNGFLGDTCGDGSHFQSCIIIPFVDDTSKYYLFTLDYRSSLNRGLMYSIIDMTKDNGLGDVIEKGTFVEDSFWTGMTATKHSNDKDYWIVVRRMPKGKWEQKVEYYAYRITKNGVQQPVISQEDPNNEVYKTCKLSPNGQYLYSGVGVYNFDNTNGKIDGFRNLRKWELYSVGEFSPNSKVLYAYYMGVSGQYIEQFDLTEPDLESTSIYIDSGMSYNCGKGSIQLGMDNRIYVSNISGDVNVIRKPNILGLGCDYNINEISMEGRYSGWEFPNFSTHYFNNPTSSTLKLPNLKVDIYPNPSSSIINIKIPEYESILNAYLVDVTGVLIKRILIPSPNTQFNIEEIDEGVYFLMIYTKSKMIIKKVIKQ